eukprot:2772419-Amphidinium_carterae.1
MAFVACHWIADATLGVTQAQMVQQTSDHVRDLDVDMVVVGGDFNFTWVAEDNLQNGRPHVSHPHRAIANLVQT